MKRFLLPVVAVISLAACKKDDNSAPDKNCGAVFQVQNFEGGVSENFKGVICGDQLKSEQALTGVHKRTIFYKGDTRKKVKYMVAKRTSSSGDWEIYIRYENNIVPDNVVKKYTTSPYKGEVQELTGLEKANW